jgi:hypothetical protein
MIHGRLWGNSHFFLFPLFLLYPRFTLKYLPSPPSYIPSRLLPPSPYSFLVPFTRVSYHHSSPHIPATTEGSLSFPHILVMQKDVFHNPVNKVSKSVLCDFFCLSNLIKGLWYTQKDPFMSLSKADFNKG